MRSYWTTVTNLEFYDALRRDAEFDGATNWTISRNARRGDVVFLYVCSPVSAIVAFGFLATDPAQEWDLNSPWYGQWFADISGLTMLEHPMTRTGLLTRFEGWGYWKQPHQSVRIPDKFAWFFDLIIEKKYGIETV